MALFGLCRSRVQRPRPCTRATVRLNLEALEDRLVLSPVAPPTITLDPANDEFGSQIQTVTQFGDANRVVLGILDTGASPVGIASTDQAAFGDAAGNLDPVPVKVAGGASGGGVGGTVTGDVSKPLTVLTDGLHAATVTIDDNTFNMTVTANFGPGSARAFGVQAFVGTDSGSPDLPTISGTPIFNGGLMSAFRTKLAAKVDLINGVDLYGVGLLEPDVHFVANTTKLVPGANELLATIPLGRIGVNNLANPGNDISSFYNFVSNSVQLNNTASSHVYSVAQQKFLLDTGSQMTVVSTAEANALHINLASPVDTIQVQGVGGVENVNGYVIDSLQVGLAGVGPMTVKNVPVFVLDAAPGQVDGILGMNLWNNVDQMLINPFTPFGATSLPTLSLTWDPSYTGGANSGGLGFQLNTLLAGHHGPWTLNQLLGGAASYFQVPDRNPDSSLVTASAAAAPGDAPLRAPVPSGLSANVLSANVATSGVAPRLTVNVGNIPAAAHAATLSISARTSLTSFATPLEAPDGWAGQPLTDNASPGKHTEARAADVGTANLPGAVLDATEGAFETLTSGSALASVIDAGGVVCTGQPCSLAEAALLVALGLVVRDYWLEESNERTVTSGISFQAG